MSSENGKNIFLWVECAPRLASERERLGYNSAAAASRAFGVTPQQWAAYERGANVPGGNVLMAFQAMGGDLAYVFGGKLVPPNTANSDRAAYDAGLQPDERALLDNYRHATEEGRQALRQVGAALAQPIGACEKKGR